MSSVMREIQNIFTPNTAKQIATNIKIRKHYKLNPIKQTTTL